MKIICSISLLVFLLTSCNKNSETSKPSINFNPQKDYGTMTDIEGNIYKTIVIGKQEWMAQNLKTTFYNDGSPIPPVPEDLKIDPSKEPYYCWNNYTYTEESEIYGAFYNWHVVKTGKLCPSGWHLPTKEEYLALIEHLGGIDVAGGKLKEVGTDHWNSSNKGASNESGFSALPAGNNIGSTLFPNKGYYGYFWSSTESGPGYSYALVLSFAFESTSVSDMEQLKGLCIRCLRDK